ncbi:Uncharacterized protein OBRU01_15382, partial [Operophtera brumata]
GWTNPLIADWFADYARVVYSLYADRVKSWLTINEPLIICDATYNTGILAPTVVDPEVGTYLCNKYVLMAHAKAWRVYDEEFRAQYRGQYLAIGDLPCPMESYHLSILSQNIRKAFKKYYVNIEIRVGTELPYFMVPGEVSIANHLIWFEPETPENEDIAELAREYTVGRYSHPIYSKEGGWPPAIEKVMAENSKKQGYPRTNLPPFTPEEIELVKGTYDFYAMNHYTSRVIRHAKQGEVLITENGYPNTGGRDDYDRIDFYKKYLKQVHHYQQSGDVHC